MSMKLICEVTEDIKLLKEGVDNASPKYFIEGIFMQSEIKNRNGRMYPKDLLIREVNRYISEYVMKNRAFGELGHPDNPTINLDRVSHIITELKRDGNNFIGKAKLTETPMGNIAKGLLESGANLGVSSRAMGSLKESNGVMVVQNDLKLSTAADIVADPSAPEAFVSAVMEEKEWVWNNGVLVEKEVSEYKGKIKKASKKSLAEEKFRIFEDFLSKL